MQKWLPQSVECDPNQKEHLDAAPQKGCSPEHAPPRFNPPEVNAHLNPSIQTILAFVRCARWCQHAHSCVDEGRDGYVGFNSFLAEQMRTSIPKVTNGVMKVALNSFLTRGWLAHPSSEEQRRPLG
jgi:hypothetical protein